MYSEVIIERNLDRFHANEGWRPVRHSIGEVEEFNATMNKILRFESNSKFSWPILTRNISEKHRKEIKRWVENEQVMSALDSDYWETRYAYLVDEGGNLQKFRNRKSQEVFDKIIAQFDEKEVSIQLLILKGRQVGITSKVALKFIHRMLFIPNTLAVMASVQAEKSKEIEVKLNAAYKGCPFWLVPAWRTKKELHNGSRLNIESGMQPKGIAQGKTPNCLVPSTLVRTADGFFKSIKDLVAGDAILTHAGKMRLVKDSFATRPDGDITKVIKIWGHHKPLECTLDHPVRTQDGWTPASDISVGDYVCHPVREISHTIDFISVTHKRATHSKDSHLMVPVDYDLGYLAGFYLAEGTVHKAKNISQITFAIHKREENDRIESLRKVVGEQWNIRAKDHERNGAVLNIYCAWLARWLSENFGNTRKKHVPDWTWSAGKGFCLGVLRGFMDGDGHFEKQSNNVVALTIDQQIAYQMRDLVASIGIGWSSIYYVPGRIQGGSLKQPVWRLVLSGITGANYRKVCGVGFNTPMSRARHWRYTEENAAVELMVESVSDGWSESFWDIEVDDESHSFTTEQCSVHNCIHISEISLIPNPKNVIEEGLLPATHSNKNLFMVFEGTGSGNVGWFPDFWRDQKKSFPTGDARMCPIFIPWPMATDLYPQADWIREHPVPLGFYERREEATKKHVARCESFIRNTDYLARVAGSNYRMPLEQQWFWQFEYRQARERHTLQQHAARMPADDFEALTGVHDTVFDPEVIGEVEEHVYEVITDKATGADIKQRKEPVKSYAIVGHSIDYKFDPDESTVDEDSPIVNITWTNNREERYEWQMIPLLPFNEDNEIETMDRLLIYEEPQRGFEYSLGIDTAHGLGKPDEERFCGSMTKVGKDGGYDVQVAEYTSNRLSPSQAVPFMACLAAHYGQKSGNPRGVKFTIEQVEGPGDTCQNQLKIMGFNWHYTPGRLDGRKIKDENRHREGFYSNKTTVPILMDRFVEAFNGGWYRPKSKYLIEECKSLERHMVSGGRDKMEHQKGKFDDRIRAAAMSYLSSHTYDDLTARSQKRYSVPNRRKVDPNEGRCMLNSISVGADE